MERVNRMCFQTDCQQVFCARHPNTNEVTKCSRRVAIMRTCATKAANTRAVQSVKYVGL